MASKLLHREVRRLVSKVSWHFTSVWPAPDLRACGKPTKNRLVRCAIAGRQLSHRKQRARFGKVRWHHPLLSSPTAGFLNALTIVIMRLAAVALRQAQALRSQSSAHRVKVHVHRCRIKTEESLDRSARISDPCQRFHLRTDIYARSTAARIMKWRSRLFKPSAQSRFSGPVVRFQPVERERRRDLAKIRRRQPPPRAFILGTQLIMARRSSADTQRQRKASSSQFPTPYRQIPNHRGPSQTSLAHNRQRPHALRSEVRNPLLANASRHAT